MKPTSCARTAKEKQYEVPNVRYALQILELLGSVDDSIGPTEVMVRLGINKHMAFRILRTMEEMEWIVREPDSARYMMGLRPFHYVSHAVNRMDIMIAAEIPMKQLWDEKGCLCLLCVLNGLRVTPIRKMEQRSDFRYTVDIGTLHPLYCSAPGKVMLAWHEEELFDKVALEGFTAYTEHTITDVKKLKDHLADIRANGFALYRFECADGLLCLAAPIFDYSGKCVGAINTSVLTAQYNEQRLLDELKDPIMTVAQRTSITLGFRYDPSNRHTAERQ